ncbi:hypothetical protein B0T26DRAFT_122623 [Lasiosphaeria miniovina]|uniref:Uncharacterized protein n=1 Tax=Lasiosphaeria miniovina TaxID=1954250 RepID=A0AA40B489_9PEZI|nr:uncharacterized protein B0T26DRAFT_122623 [Lasiosphaeria miniovina]KAK0727202.1 hypothetical protein B0T26DRAFT_122623 [Lasiosphaeria miniovina]
MLDIWEEISAHSLLSLHQISRATGFGEGQVKGWEKGRVGWVRRPVTNLDWLAMVTQQFPMDTHSHSRNTRAHTLAQRNSHHLYVRSMCVQRITQARTHKRERSITLFFCREEMRRETGRRPGFWPPTAHLPAHVSVVCLSTCVSVLKRLLILTESWFYGVRYILPVCIACKDNGTLHKERKKGAENLCVCVCVSLSLFPFSREVVSTVCMCVWISLTCCCAVANYLTYVTPGGHHPTDRPTDRLIDQPARGPTGG